MKKLFYLAMGYLAGSAVFSLYSDKKGKDLKKDIKKASENGKHDPKMVLLENFIETHKNFFNDLKDIVDTKENRQYLKDKKEEVLDLIDRYKDDSEMMIDQLKGKGKKYMSEVSEKLEEFYKEKKKEGEEYLSSIGSKEDVTTFKEKLGLVYEDLKTKLKKSQ
ncbi:hypothetical protein EOM39_06085 [Candidatus Gracilibacteria bacterium]|nr:hypothetical protein [Candidatus Gracilibacteria bacterium]